ncbi:MAG: hypothetical protein ACE5HV_12900, partial [Acidobacteriota bacterium]
YLPTLLQLPGAGEQVRLTEEWLRGETVIPEIADKWTTGPAIPIEVVAPKSARPGEKIRIQVVAVNNKPGHDFPTGPLDIIQAWIDLQVHDQDGNLVYESGRLSDDNFLGPDATVFKAEAIDQYGNLIDKHNLWEMVGARFKRTLFPGYSDVVTYAFFCPDLVPAIAGDSSEAAASARKADAAAQSPLEKGADRQAALSPALPPRTADLVVPGGGAELVVSARLRYRKVDQYLVNFLFPDQGMTAAITDISWAQARIRIEPAAGDPTTATSRRTDRPKETPTGSGR